MKDFYELFNELLKEFPEISATEIILLILLLYVVGRILEFILKKILENLYQIISGKRKIKREFARIEYSIREYIIKLYSVNWLLSLPVISKYFEDGKRSDFYVPLSYDLMIEGKHSKAITIDKVFNQCQSFVVTGSHGSGKSTLLEQLAVSYAQDHFESDFNIKESRLPFFISCKEIEECIPLEELLATRSPITSYKRGKEFILEQLANGRCAIILDGLDETSRENRIKNIIPWIQESLSKYSKNRFIISCRENEWYDRRIPSLPIVRMNELTITQIKKIISKWSNKEYKDLSVNSRDLWMTLKANEDYHDYRNFNELMDFAKNPLLLTLIIILYKNGFEIPTKKYEIYYVFLKVMLDEWDDIKNIKDIYNTNSLNTNMNILGGIAIYLKVSKLEIINLNQKEIRNECEIILNEETNLEKESIEDFLERISRRTGVINRNHEGIYEFPIKGFYEFLIAHYLSNRKDQNFLIEYLHDNSWNEIISFYSAMNFEPDAFFNSLYTLDPFDIHTLEYLSIGLIDNKNLNQKNRENWIEHILEGFRRHIFLGSQCLSLAFYINELDRAKFLDFVKESLLSKSEKQVTIIIDIIIGLNDYLLLTMLLESFDRLESKYTEYIIKMLAESRLDESSIFLWDLIENPNYYDKVIESLKNKGEESIYKCESILSNKKSSITKSNAALHILSSFKNFAALDILLNHRNSANNEIRQAIIKSISINYSLDGDFTLEALRKKIDSLYMKFFKGLFDRVLAFIMLILLFPIMTFLALGVKLSSKGPIFYKFKFVGRDRKQFFLLKFRSMYHYFDFDNISSNYDPRVTFFGKFMRKSRLNELPMLISIINGDLSFVGPRPDSVYFYNKIKEMSPLVGVRKIVKPGMLGTEANLTYAINESELLEIITKEIHYVINCSFWRDIKILIIQFKEILKAQKI